MSDEDEISPRTLAAAAFRKLRIQKCLNKKMCITGKYVDFDNC